jgi:hypothetical protein
MSQFKRTHSKVEQRFVGNGNCWLDGGRLRGWKVRCSRCPAEKVIKSHNTNSLPPHMIIRKMQQAKWQVGNREADDLCPDCQVKARRASLGKTLEYASKVINAAAKPMVPAPNGQRVPYDELLHMTQSLAPEQTKELIKTLQANLPKRTFHKKPPAPLPESDSDYEAWLNSLK